MDNGELLARESIRLTVSIYNSAVDRGAYHELTSVFAPDGMMIVSDLVQLEGRDTIIEGLTDGAKKRGGYEPGNFQRHLLGNSIINVLDADNAKSIHYIMVVTELGLDHSGTYADTFVRSGDRWLIQQRLANMEWARPDSRFFTFPGKTRQFSAEELDVQFRL